MASPLAYDLRHLAWVKVTEFVVKRGLAMGESHEALDIDRFDRLIIDQLRIDGRQPFVDVARTVGLSEAVVRRRYARLHRLGVLQVVGMVDAPRIGELFAHVCLRVRGVPVATVADALAKLPQVKFVALSSGSYDLVIDVSAADVSELAELLNGKIHRIKGVYQVEVSTALETYKDSYLWAGFREPPATRSAILPR